MIIFDLLLENYTGAESDFELLLFNEHYAAAVSRKCTTYFCFWALSWCWTKPILNLVCCLDNFLLHTNVILNLHVLHFLQTIRLLYEADFAFTGFSVMEIILLLYHCTALLSASLIFEELCGWVDNHRIYLLWQFYFRGVPNKLVVSILMIDSLIGHQLYMKHFV